MIHYCHHRNYVIRSLVKPVQNTIKLFPNHLYIGNI